MEIRDLGGFNTPLSPMRFQSQIGRETKRVYKEGQNVVKLSLARVVRVNYKYNTVDVVTTLWKNDTSRNPTDNGKFSARLPVALGGRTPDGKVYGSNTLVTEGSLVLIGFLEGNKDTPIVLNIYGDADNQSLLTRTTYTGADATDEELQRELWSLFTLYPSMTYKNIDGNGNQEITFSGKTFMLITDTDPDNAYVQDYEFGYDHLPNSRYANGETIEPKSPNSPTLLYVHQGVYDKHRVTFFIKSDGTVRLGSRHIEGEGITFQELNTDGSFSIVQQKDTANPEGQSHKFSKFAISETGNLILQSQKHKLEIRNDGIFVDGKPISSIGGGDVDLGPIKEQIDELGKEILEQNVSIGIIDGKIEMKADSTQVNDLTKRVERNSAELVIMDGKIQSMVSREEYEIDLEEIRKYADQLLEGVTIEIDDVKDSVTNLNDYIDGAFHDGIIEESEAQAIAQHIENLNTEKADVDAKYTEIHSNTYLNEDQKLELTQVKEAYDTKHRDLIDIINIATADGKISSEESEAVALAFADYRTALANLSKGFELAIDRISAAKALEAEDNARKYADGEFKKVNSSIIQLADLIEQKIDSEEVIRIIDDVEMHQAEIEKQLREEIASNRSEIEEVAKTVPYKVELVSTNGNVFKNGVIDTTIFCKVYHGTTEVTDTIDASRFNWTRVSDNPQGDTEWNNSKGKGKKSIRVTSADVTVRATFMCEVSSA